MFYNSSNSFEYNDCVSKGACSISPAISSMQEVMLILLRQIAYYLLKLKEFKIANNEITFSLIYQITLLDAVKDFSEYQVLNLFSKHYKNLVKVRKEYLKMYPDKTDANLADIQTDPSFIARRDMIDKMVDGEVAKRGREINNIERPNDVYIIASYL